MTANLEAHKNLFVAKLRWLAKVVVPRTAPQHVALSITTGAHNGYITELSATSLTVGSDEDCDLMLLDDLIAPHHATLKFDWSVLGTVVSVFSDQDDVFINGNPVTQDGRAIVAQLPATVMLHSVEVALASVRRSKAATPARPLGRVKRTAFVLLMLLALVLPLEWLIRTIAPTQMTVNFSAPASAQVSQETTLEATLEALAVRLASADLDDFISLRYTSPRLLEADGILPSARLADWEDVHRWFDAEFSDVTLTSSVHAAPVLSDFPAIAMVRLSDPMEVLFLNGNRASIGDLVVDGWRIANIKTDGLALNRNGDSLNINF